MTITYAIGDVHGRRDLLDALLTAIREDAATHRSPWRVVFLGDIVDRGPESREALDLVFATLKGVPGSALIQGNHEEIMLRFADVSKDRVRFAQFWYRNGGTATLASFGLDHLDTARRVAAALATSFPGHLAALRDTPSMLVDDRYCYVHGGIDPRVPLDEQDPRKTRWIREEFLEHRGPFERIVVHGHTPTESTLPEVHANRIAIDTGAFYSGHLTCAILNDAGNGPPRFLATDDHGERIEVTQVEPLVFD